ncbi:MAG: Spy/CpxP family protein refolding chaperone [Beijerinckiaceae bacterium]
MTRFRILLATTALLGGLAVVAVQAQTAPPSAQDSGPFFQQTQGRDQFGSGQGRMSEEDRTRMMDRHLGDMKARLQLNADQEKLWPPVENAMREMQKTTAELRDQMRTAMQAERGENWQGPDPATRMRNMAAMSTARANGLLKVADALDPLYKTLDDSQKRRFADMSRFGQMGGEGRGYGGRGRDDGRGENRRWRERDYERGDDRGRGRGYEEERGQGWRDRGFDGERGYGRRWRDEDQDRSYGRRWRDDERERGYYGRERQGDDYRRRWE